jgi:hypothetical protein
MTVMIPFPLHRTRDRQSRNSVRISSVSEQAIELYADPGRKLLEAVPHRHTHRGSFSPESLPDGLLARLQHDAMAGRLPRRDFDLGRDLGLCPRQT